MPLHTEFARFQGSVMSDQPTFLLITSKSCSPCEAFKPQFETAREALNEFAHFHVIDSKDLPNGFLATRNVRVAPTVLMYRFGLEENRMFGVSLQSFQINATGFISEYYKATSGDKSEYEFRL